MKLHSTRTGGLQLVLVCISHVDVVPRVGGEMESPDEVPLMQFVHSCRIMTHSKQ